MINNNSFNLSVRNTHYIFNFKKIFIIIPFTFKKGDDIGDDERQIQQLSPSLSRLSF